MRMSVQTPYAEAARIGGSRSSSRRLEVELAGSCEYGVLGIGQWPLRVRVPLRYHLT